MRAASIAIPARIWPSVRLASMPYMPSPPRISNRLLKVILAAWWLMWAAIFALVGFILWTMDGRGRP